MLRWIVVALSLLLCRVAFAAPDWSESFAAFDAADRAKAPPQGAVVFVGSSSIRLWRDLEGRCDALPAIQRGFGGSLLADCAANVDRLVNRYRPRAVVLYAGDNDLAAGRSPAEVLASFETFVVAVQRALPETRIAYVSIKPSPSRAALLDRVRETNALIRAHIAAHPERLDFIDVYGAMVDADGAPRAELFGPDALHMNEAGYALWQRAISARLH
jgi:lysophospholipase L1-like esterase